MIENGAQFNVHICNALHKKEAKFSSIVHQVEG